MQDATSYVGTYVTFTDCTPFDRVVVPLDGSVVDSGGAEWDGRVAIPSAGFRVEYSSGGLGIQNGEVPVGQIVGVVDDKDVGPVAGNEGLSHGNTLQRVGNPHFGSTKVQRNDAPSQCQQKLNNRERVRKNYIVSSRTQEDQ